MPSHSTLSTDDKGKIKKAVPTSSSTNKIITAAVGRVYQAKEGARSLVYRIDLRYITAYVRCNESSLQHHQVVVCWCWGSSSLLCRPGQRWIMVSNRRSYRMHLDSFIAVKRFSCADMIFVSLALVISRCDMGTWITQRDWVQSGKAFLPHLARRCRSSLFPADSNGI